MLLTTDLNGTLGLCYCNKEIERFMRENLTDEEKEKIRDPDCTYLRRIDTFIGPGFTPETPTDNEFDKNFDKVQNNGNSE